MIFMLLFRGGFFQLVEGFELVRIDGLRAQVGVADRLDLVAAGGDLFGEEGFVLEGVQLDVAHAEGFVGQVEGVELDQFDEDLVAALVEHFLHGVPLAVHSAVDADADDALAFLGRLVFVELFKKIGGHGVVLLEREGGVARFFPLLEHVFGDELRAVGADDFGVVGIVRLGGAGGDDADERVVARAQSPIPIPIFNRIINLLFLLIKNN